MFTWRERLRTSARAAHNYMPALPGRLHDRFYNIEDMVRHFAVCAMLAPRMHRLRHISQPHPATVLRIAMCQRYLSPLLIFRAAQVDRPAKSIGVRSAEGAFGAVYLNI